MSTDTELPDLGHQPWMRIAALLFGLALLAGGAYIGVTWGSIRSMEKLIAAFVIAGLGLIWFSMFIKGASFAPGHIRTWSYTLWIFGGVRENFPTDIQAIALNEAKGKYIAGLRMKDGSLIPLEYKDPSIKDAQAFIDKIAAKYGIEVALEVNDPEKIQEAARFAAARRWNISCYLFEKVEYVDLCDAEDSVTACITFQTGFISNTVEAWDVGGSTTARWQFKVSGTKTTVKDNGVESGTITLKKSFMGQEGVFIYQKTGGLTWSGLLETDNDKRSTFSIKLYRGLFEKAGTAAERQRCLETQGPAAQVALIHGTMPELCIDVLDESAREWFILALAATWGMWKPDYSLPKGEARSVLLPAIED